MRVAVRHLHKIPVPAPYADGELSVTDIAGRLQVSTGAVYYWISNGQLTARRGRGNRLCVTWNNDVEAACQRPRTSNPNTSRQEGQYETTVPTNPAYFRRRLTSPRPAGGRLVG